MTLANVRCDVFVTVLCDVSVSVKCVTYFTACKLLVEQHVFVKPNLQFVQIWYDPNCPGRSHNIGRSNLSLKWRFRARLSSCAAATLNPPTHFRSSETPYCLITTLFECRKIHRRHDASHETTTQTSSWSGCWTSEQFVAGECYRRDGRAADFTVI